MEISVQEHRKIIDAFKNKDGEKADNLVRKTAAYGGQVLIQSIAQEEGRRVEKSILQRVVDV
jgi:DNA-binding GntR family transcriptional regulator